MSNSGPAPGRLFLVAAPSGAGKTSLVQALVERDPRLVISVSHTTRDPRPGEVDGEHYHFIDVDTFRGMLEAGEFLEHAVVFGNLYGTHAATTQALLERGRDVILEIDWQGARQVRDAYSESHGIFILPPSLEALRKRLGGRAQDSEAIIEERMARARAEISHCDEFEYVIVNDDFETALEELQSIIRCCRENVRCEQEPHTRLLAELLGNG